MAFDRKKQLERERRRIMNELSDIEDGERRQAAKWAVGKCFKYRNCYSCPEKESDYWWLYVRVDRVNRHGMLVCTEIQRDKYGDVSMKFNRQMFPNQVGDGSNYVRITSRQFVSAARSILRPAVDAVATSVESPDSSTRVSSSSSSDT